MSMIAVNTLLGIWIANSLLLTILIMLRIIKEWRFE